MMKNRWNRWWILLACFLLGCTAQKEETGALQQEDLYSCTYQEGARFSLQVGQQVRLTGDDGTEQQVQVDVENGSVVCNVWDDPQQDTHASYTMSESGQVRDIYLCCENGNFVIACVVQIEYKNEEDTDDGLLTRQTVFLSFNTGEMQEMDGIFLPEQEQLGVTSGTNLGISDFTQTVVGKDGVFTTESRSSEQGRSYMTNCPLVILAGGERDNLTGDDFVSADAVYRVVPAGVQMNVQSAETVVFGNLYGSTAMEYYETATAYFVSSSGGEYEGYILVQSYCILLLQDKFVRQVLTTGYSQRLVRQDHARTGYTVSTLYDEPLSDDAAGVSILYDPRGSEVKELAQPDDQYEGLYAEAPEGTQSVRVEYVYEQYLRWELYGITWKGEDGQETSVFYMPFMGSLVPMRLCELTEEGLLVPMDGNVALPEEPDIVQGYIGLLQGDYLGQYTRMGANLLVRVQ
jgi:hypothetical protein